MKGLGFGGAAGVLDQGHTKVQAYVGSGVGAGGGGIGSGSANLF